jgi:preprotein translocase subunit SecE
LVERWPPKPQVGGSNPSALDKNKRGKMSSNLRISTLNIKKKRLNYFRDIQAEFKKITWTTRYELVAFTKIVLWATLVFGFIIYFADLIIRNMLLLINIIFRWIA